VYSGSDVLCRETRRSCGRGTITRHWLSRDVRNSSSDDGAIKSTLSRVLTVILGFSWAVFAILPPFFRVFMYRQGLNRAMKARACDSQYASVRGGETRAG
jgi:hypothetical protein